MPTRLVVVWLALLLGVQPGAAQQGEWQPSATTGELAYLSFNTLTGALTAGVAAKLRGKSFSEAAVQGALGGAVVYGGKRLAVADLPAAGLAGRQVAAIGTSAVRNASEGRNSWERLIVPLVLARLHVNLPERQIEGVRVNLTELATLGYLASRQELTLNWKASLSAGAPVLDAKYQQIRSDGGIVNGFAADGVIVMGGIRDTPYDQVLKHERVHVLQHDFLTESWTSPAEIWLLRRLPYGDRLADRVQVGISTWVLGGVVSPAIEAEASFLERR